MLCEGRAAAAAGCLVPLSHCTMGAVEGGRGMLVEGRVVPWQGLECHKLCVAAEACCACTPAAQSMQGSAVHSHLTFCIHLTWRGRLVWGLRGLGQVAAHSVQFCLESHALCTAETCNTSTVMASPLGVLSGQIQGFTGNVLFSTTPHSCPRHHRVWVPQPPRDPSRQPPQALASTAAGCTGKQQHGTQPGILLSSAQAELWPRQGLHTHI